MDDTYSSRLFDVCLLLCLLSSRLDDISDGNRSRSLLSNSYSSDVRLNSSAIRRRNVTDLLGCRLGYQKRIVYARFASSTWIGRRKIATKITKIYNNNNNKKKFAKLTKARTERPRYNAVRYPRTTNGAWRHAMIVPETSDQQARTPYNTDDVTGRSKSRAPVSPTHLWLVGRRHGRKNARHDNSNQPLPRTPLCHGTDDRWSSASNAIEPNKCVHVKQADTDRYPNVRWDTFFSSFFFVAARPASRWKSKWNFIFKKLPLGNCTIEMYLAEEAWTTFGLGFAPKVPITPK